MILEISCIEVWREISRYVDGETDSELRDRMKAHFKICKHCSAILDGTRNVVRLMGGGCTFEVPAGFSDRLYKKLNPKLGN